MSVTMQNGRAASPQAITALEQILGRALPVDYLAFVAVHDGATPEGNFIAIGPENESTVSGFVPVAEIPREIQRVDGFPPGWCPVAWDASGNYFCLGQRDGAVYFWDHEVPEPPKQLVGSFKEFLERLQPFDPRSVQLKPGQVKSAWINPDFLKKLRE